MAGWTGLEPATFCVTGRRSNQLSYHPINWERVRNVEFKRDESSVVLTLSALIPNTSAPYAKYAVVAQLDRAAVF